LFEGMGAWGWLSWFEFMNKELKVMGSKFDECVKINLTINY